MAGLDDFYRGDIGREIAADLETDRQPGDTRRPGEIPRRPSRAAFDQAESGHGLYLAAADPGLATLLILGIFEKLGRPKPKATTICTA